MYIRLSDSAIDQELDVTVSPLSSDAEVSDDDASQTEYVMSDDGSEVSVYVPFASAASSSHIDATAAPDITIPSTYSPPTPPSASQQLPQQHASPPPLPHQGQADTFVWRDCDDFEPDVPVFDDANAGIQAEFPCSPTSKAMNFFTAFFDVGLMSLLVKETNEFREFSINFGNRSVREEAKMLEWTAVTIPELYVWFALTMLMPHVRKHRLKDYWSKDYLLTTPVFGRHMSRDRYFDILSYLHFSTSIGPQPNDRLYKIRPILSMLLEKIRMFFLPFQKVLVDESLVLFRGRLSFIQYIPSKRHRFGIKFFVICDCKTGYVLDFVVYTGTDVDVASNDPMDFLGQLSSG
ncbi:piggyBac transposable element-derived protein 4-like [Portunus trituberculatus]|uniref:piggyBac transposable element-derived protein 4-like n=1 Tax=Portunus trituberculatus TaxID=210409 RepID=UPI001E1D16C5|nr:piggyBac transposable element-derived protein 4-like [Portunus trituberculatus]